MPFHMLFASLHFTNETARLLVQTSSPSSSRTSLPTSFHDCSTYTANMSSKPGPPCPTCTEPGRLNCTACNGISYCSEECRDTDWPAHRLLCSNFSKLEARPSQSARRVLYFPADATAPQFIWLEIGSFKDEPGKVICQQPKMGEVMDGPEWPHFDVLTRNEITRVNLKGEHHIHVCYDSSLVDTRVEPNLAALNTARYCHAYPWRGPIIAFYGIVHGSDEDADIVEVKDIGMRQFSDVAAYLIDKDNEAKKYRSTIGPKIHAVKILCDGEKDTNSQTKRFQAMILPRRHPLILDATGGLLHVARYAGLSLVGLFLPKKSKLDRTNHVASTLLAQVDGLDGSILFPPGQDEKAIGSLLLMQEDLTPLTMEFAEAFAAFSHRLYLLCTQREASGLARPPGTMDLDEVTPGKWEAFRSEWESDKLRVIEEIQAHDLELERFEGGSAVDAARV